MERINEKATETAKKIRKELKKTFPEIKFSVRSSSYTGGSSVSVNWEDGPMVKEVEKVTEKFSSSSFDGMQDMKVTTGYQYEGKIYKGADYIFANRSLSPAYKEIIQKHAKRLFEDFSINDVDYHSKMLRAEKDMNNMINKRNVPDEIEEPYGEDTLYAMDEPGELYGENKLNEEPQQATLINFQEEKMKKNLDKLTAEQKFKLLALGKICNIDDEHVQGIMDRGISIDRLFTAIANTYYDEMEKVTRS